MNTVYEEISKNYRRNKIKATTGQQQAEQSNQFQIKVYTCAGSNRQPNWPTANKVTKNRWIVKNCTNCKNSKKTADKIVKFRGKPAGWAQASRRLKMHSPDAIRPRLVLSTSSQSDYPTDHPIIHLSIYLTASSWRAKVWHRRVMRGHCTRRIIGKLQIVNTLQLNRKQNQNTNYAESSASNLFWDLKSV